MWRALVVLALVGCGGVTTEGMTDPNGCPTQAGDLNGTATVLNADPACAAAPPAIVISNGTYNGEPLASVPGAATMGPYISFTSGECRASFAIVCGYSGATKLYASYLLVMDPQ